MRAVGASTYLESCGSIGEGRHGQGWSSFPSRVLRSIKIVSVLLQGVGEVVALSNG